MPTTRRQAAALFQPEHDSATTAKSAAKGRKAAPRNVNVKASPDAVIGEKREAGQTEKEVQKAKEEPPAKKTKIEKTTEGKLKAEETDQTNAQMQDKKEQLGSKEKIKVDDSNTEPNLANNIETKKGDFGRRTYESGVIERGHIYFFYRPRVELEEAVSLDDVQRFYMLLIPRPPEFSTAPNEPSHASGEEAEDQEMNLLEPGADVVPAAEPTDQPKKNFRLLVIGKKSLPDPEVGGGKGGGRHQVFWATIVTVGDDLKELQEGLGASTYETKTRGTRHQGSARLAARGAYAIVNSEARTPSGRETHLGYYLSHPTSENFGKVQTELGIHTTSSFVLQVKNPLAPPVGPGRIGLPKGRRVDYPEDIMRQVFGKGGGRGREDFGLRFTSVEWKDMLDYEGVELLFIAARSGDVGLETSLGEGRGSALHEKEEDEAKESIQDIFKELAMDAQKIPAEPLEGEWA
ncbi:hypothetical protein BKA93DRAFT_825472 [Sparassis latifolia]